MNNHIYALSDIIVLLDRGFKQLFSYFEFWFKTEVTRISIKNNIVYMELVEFDDNSQIKARSKGIVFDKDKRKKFMNDLKIKDIEELKGLELLFMGKLNFHKEYGISIIIEQISSEFVIGQFHKNISDIQARLKQENIYDNNKSLLIGYPPFKIAAISSSGSAGLQDFQTILEQSKINFNIKLYESAVHGNNAKLEVYQQLKQIYKDIKNDKNFDLVVILRGGGASDGILWQNDYNIAKGICHMQVPVIVAVGHTDDKSILSEIANLDAKTPSDAAYLIIDITNNYLEKTLDIYNRIREKGNTKLQYYVYDIEQKYKSIQLNANKNINQINTNLDFYYNSIMSISPERLVKYGYGILNDMNDKLLSKSKVDKLKKDDNLKLKIYDKNFIIKIIG